MGKDEGNQPLNMEEKIARWWSDLQKERKCKSTSAIAKIVNKCSLEEQEKARTFISKCIRQSIASSIECKDLIQLNNLCTAINGCFDNFTQAADAANISFNEIIEFMDICFDECNNELFINYCAQCDLIKIIDLLHSSSRILVLVLKLRRPSKYEQKSFDLPEICSSVKEIMTKLSASLSIFIKVKELSLDTKCNLVMSSLLIREILVNDKEKLLEYHKNFLGTLPNTIFDAEYEVNVLKFLFSNAILNTWSNIVIDAISTGIYLKFFINLCESYSSDTAIILSISRALLLLVKNDCFKEFMKTLDSANSDLTNSLLSCIYMLLDHPVPCVRHSSKDFLRLLAAYEEFKLPMLKSLSTLPFDKRSYYICLVALANEVGSQSLIDIDPELPKNLILSVYDPSLVSYVINALDSLIVKDCLVGEDFSEWCERWIVPLLVSLSDVPLAASADIEKLLDGLFKRYPAAVSYIIEKWFEPKSDEELRYIMTALKIYNKHGFKKQESVKFEVHIKSSSDLQEKKWKDLISEKLLRFCIHHSDDDIRVSAFSLIIQGLKSTELYTEQDFSLIQYALTCNLNNQQPATRQKLLSIIKKMLARYGDSLAVLKRNQKNASHSMDITNSLTNYNKFQEWLFNFCFSNMFDGANFNRLNTVLSLLLLCFENMDDVKVDDSLGDTCWKKILVPLRSSYEENKVMAVTLAKKLNLVNLLKDNETIKLMFIRGYELCGRMEPPNVLTGAYLIQMLQEFPAVKDVIEENLADSVSGIDSDLLNIIMLSKKLKEQICVAERNLFEAAMNGPMYGTLFAIRIILREANFIKLGEKKEGDRPNIKGMWKRILKILIDLSIRMTQVVHCVVNNPSPEGHLPLDFEPDFDFMMNEDVMTQEEMENNRVERNLNEASVAIRTLTLHDCAAASKREEIINDCERFMRRCNKIFLSHGESSSYSRKNAMDFNDMLKDCARLIYEMNKISQYETNQRIRTNQTTGYIGCLCLIENEFKRMIEIYEKNNDQKHGLTAQVLLLCSWRSIKEACLFLGDLVSKLPLEKMFELELLTEEMVIKIGEELVALLCEIKHRGAFEHAYLGFSQLITAFFKCPRTKLSELPKKWLEAVLGELKQPREKQKLKFCTSRRSAGLPFLIQAIISSELESTNSAKIQTLDMTMDTLLDIVETENDSGLLESKINSLNTLRALYKHAMLGEYVAPYVSRGLMATIRGSRAAAWGIRNASSLLFSSLVIRIFGVARNRDTLSKKNRMTGRHFFQRYPELYEFFLKEMELALQSDLRSCVYYPQPHLFDMLYILGRLYPPPTEDPLSIDFSEFLPFIDATCRNSTLKIRELGAKALVPLISVENFTEELDMRFSLLQSDDIDSNHRHGILLQVRTILAEIGEYSSVVRESVEERGVNWVQNTAWILNKCKKPTPYLIKISYIQILHMLFKASHSVREEIRDLLTKQDLLDDINKLLASEKNIPGCFAYLETLYFVKLDVAAHVWLEHGNSDELSQLFISMLTSDIDEIQAIALAFLHYILLEGYEEERIEMVPANLITVAIKDLSCIQDEGNMKAIKSELLSQQGVIDYIIRCFSLLLHHVKSSIFVYKEIMRLQISVISIFLFQDIISVEDVYHSYCIGGASPAVLASLPYLVDCGNIDVSVAGFICYSVFIFDKIRHSGDTGLPISIPYFAKLLFSFSDPDADVKHRAAVCNVYNKFYDFFNHGLFKKDNQALSIWMLPLKLMNDEDPFVRRNAMKLVPKYQKYLAENNKLKNLNKELDDVSLSQLTSIPVKAQEALLDCYINLFDEKDLFHMMVQIVAWGLTAFINTINKEHAIKQNEDGVFESGNPNPFCEELIFGKMVCGKLEELKKSVNLKSVFEKKLEMTHIANLQEFFPSLIFCRFPQTLRDFCIEFVNILNDEGLDYDLKNVSCVPFYIAELVKIFDFL